MDTSDISQNDFPFDVYRIFARDIELIKPVHAAGIFPGVMTVLHKLDTHIPNQVGRKVGRDVCIFICYLLSNDCKQLIMKKFFVTFIYSARIPPYFCHL